MFGDLQSELMKVGSDEHCQKCGKAGSVLHQIFVLFLIFPTMRQHFIAINDDQQRQPQHWHECVALIQDQMRKIKS